MEENGCSAIKWGLVDLLLLLTFGDTVWFLKKTESLATSHFVRLYMGTNSALSLNANV